MDDILVYGNTQEEHNTHLMAVLQRIKEVEITLSKDKCEFNQTHNKYLGQVIDKTGVRPDPDKVHAILEMKPPTNTRELRQFLGMVNQFFGASSICQNPEMASNFEKTFAFSI